jgi:putative nucleotidyltransferase with HDIG domain
MLDALLESAKDLERAGAWDQALASYEQALMRLPRAGAPVRAADLLRWIGTVHRQRGELELAGEAYEASLVIAELNGLDYQRAAVLNCMGAVEHQRGNSAEAEELYAHALELAVRLDDQVLAACLDQNLGALHSLRGDLTRALDSYESVLERSRALSDGHVATHALRNIGIVHMQMGDWEASESSFESAFRMAESTGEILMTGILELSMAELHLQQQRFEEARECCARSLEVFGRLRSKYWTAEALKFYGVLHREMGRSAQADACFAMAIGLAEVAQNVLLQAEAQMEWAVVHLKAGRDQDGIMYLNRALRLFGEMQARREVLDIQERLQKMEDLYLPAVQKWSAGMLGRAHPELASHALRVADLSCLLAGELGLEGWDLMIVRVGALIHDIGYTAVPSSATALPDIATEAHPLLKVHTIAGDVIAKRLDFPVEVRSIVRSHHERADGGGFPDRLTGEAIPLATRIVAVADALDRLVHPRSRKAALSYADALDSLRGDAGAGFDPDLLQALHRVVGEENASINAA